MLAAAAVALALIRGDDPGPDRLEITREQLVRLGVELGPPDPDQPVVIARGRAERVARSEIPSPVIGSVLATCFEGDDEVGYPCWAVAHDPVGHSMSGGPPDAAARSIRAAYVVSIIDSRTGEWVGSEMGGGGRRPASPRDRSSAKENVEEAIRTWKRHRAVCHDHARPDFRGRPAFGCTVGTGRAAKDACYAVLGGNLFRVSCSRPRTDAGRLVYRGKK
jgi:hypothetical protein